MVRAYTQVRQLDNCCGVHELGGFNQSYSYDVEGDGETITDAWRDVLDQLATVPEDEDDISYVGLFLQVWFVRLQDYNDTLNPEYEEKELRELVRAIPGVIHLGTTINPNSGNEIDGYIWLNKERT